MFLSDRDMRWAIERYLLIVQSPEGLHFPQFAINSPSFISSTIATISRPWGRSIWSAAYKLSCSSQRVYAAVVILSTSGH